MDAVTHAMSGFVLAAPYFESHPEAAGTFLLATVAPDLDALSRVFGKRAFLKAHQTWSHSLPVIGFLALLLYLLPAVPASVAWAFAGGMAFHALLDWTNTYGITLWMPLSRRRFSADAVFFIDAVVVALSVAATGLTVWLWPAPSWIAASYASLLVGYVLFKLWLRRCAVKRCESPPASLLPSALSPFRWFGCERAPDCVGSFQVNGAVSEQGTVPVLDDEDVRDLPEFRIMRELSPLFVVTQREGDLLTCRDLRTRNFGARFGTLRARVGTDGPEIVEFEV